MPLLGSETPRLWTPPLRPLTPATSLGFSIIDFGEKFCGYDLLPWQKWWLIHAFELLEDGRLRYRRLLTLVSRQNGKTHLLKLVALWSMVTGRSDLVLGVAQNLQIARESWQGAIDLANAHPSLKKMTRTVRKATGDLRFELTNGCRYQITAANGKAGRGLPVDLLILDELREQHSHDAWNALSATTTARRNGLIVAISNAGEERSVVLNMLRDIALAETDETLGLFEWSAPDGCELDDREAWAQANPGLGYTIDERTLESALKTVSRGAFRTEHLCQRVDTIDTAIDLGAWASSADTTGKLAALRDRVALCLEVSPDNKHVTLVAAAQTGDGRVRLRVAGAWNSTREARAALPALVERINPQVFGWFGSGPSAALAADLRTVKRSQEIKSAEVPSICMGFAEQVTARQVMHPNDALLNAHVRMAIRSKSNGDGWRFVRPNPELGQVDALYAAAGALHLARTLKPSVGKPRIIVAA